MANVQTLERCFNEKIDRKMGNFGDTIEDRIQKAISNAIVIFISPRIELAVRSINASSGQYAASVKANSELGERIGVTAFFESVSERKNTFHELNANDEIRGIIPDKVSELSVPRRHFDHQSHTHHT